MRDLSAFFGRFDLWLTPTLGQPPVELGTLVYRGGDPFELRRRSARFSPYTYVSNASGQPAISLPLHWTASGLPVGVHFTARWGERRRPSSVWQASSNAPARGRSGAPASARPEV